MNPRLRFALFLESSGPGGAERAAQLAKGTAETTEVPVEFSVLIRLGTERSAIEGVLGPPDLEQTGAIMYRLGLRPEEYVFRFRFDARGGLLSASYCRREIRSRPDRTLAEARLLLGSMMATEDEVLAWYGEPDDTVGWWPTETWTYGGIALEFRLGVIDR